jgi:hypothetical protein
MHYHIESINLDDRFDAYSITPTANSEAKAISHLSKINIFVGANDSGKSRFLRMLCAIDQIRFIPHLNTNLDGWSHYEDSKKRFVNDFFTDVLKKFSVDDVASINHLLLHLPPLLPFVERNTITDPLFNIVNHITNLKDLSTREIAFKIGHPNQGELNAISAYLKIRGKELEEELTNIASKLITIYDFSKLYIPTLRGLRTLSGGKDSFTTRTLSDYFQDTGGNRAKPGVFTGLTLYSELHDLLLGKLSDRKLVSDFEGFISKSFFNNEPVTLIPKINQDVIDVRVGNAKELPIFALGDGIQAMIILTFPLFKNRNKMQLVFIEEPEIHMHPGLQRQFLAILNSAFPNNQYFFTTHSNHFLDLTLDLENVSVFTFTKKLAQSNMDERDALFTIENVNNESTLSLELLGVRNSSVFLSNCTIWVEGITDRKYISHFLNLYYEQANLQSNSLRQFKEDLHYSFVEYGGSNITHWSFLDDGTASTIDVERLCGKLFLITDKDSATNSAKVKRHETLKNRLGDRYYCLETREVENILSSDVIAKVVKEYEGEGAVLSHFANDSYKNEPLGSFIETTVLNGKKLRTGSYAAESGTITDKIGFCKKALHHMSLFNDLSPEAKALAESIYKFIEMNNR